ncbi:MAG: hypothetical protein CMJ93_02080, partial [Planctomycetes bacterium]|nr:hypothetical protein [Planctomycetota bacterium]
MLVLLTSLYLHFISPMHDHVVASVASLPLAQQQDLGEQLTALDKLMRGKENQAEVLESIARLRVTAVVLRNQLFAAENPGEDDSKSEMKKIIKSSRRDLAKIADNLMGVILHSRR